MNEFILAIREVAQEFAKKGFPVFPVRYKDKKPLTAHGCKDASTDLDRVAEMFSAIQGNCNIGLATGGIKRVVVVDVDLNKPGARESYHRLLEKYPELEKAPTVRTGGGGLHIYSIAPPGFEVGNHTRALGLDGIDIRGEGGYVVAPGSVHKSGNAYEFETGKSLDDLPLITLPHHLAQNLRRNLPKKQRLGAVPSSHGEVNEGNRNDSLFRQARSLCGKGLSHDEVRRLIHGRNVDQCKPPLSNIEVDKLVDSALNYGTPDGEPFTDLGNARRLIKRFGRDIRYIPERRQWYIWRDTHWVDDADGGVIQMIKSIAKELAIEGDEQ